VVDGAQDVAGLGGGVAVNLGIARGDREGDRRGGCLECGLAGRGDCDAQALERPGRAGVECDACAGRELLAESGVDFLSLPQAAPVRARTPTSAVREALFFMFIGLSLLACPADFRTDWGVSRCMFYGPARLGV